MVNILDMKDIRYINLFSKITGVKTRYCFFYNETLVFGVPKKLLSKALGKNAINVKKISEVLKRKIKIVPNPENIDDAKDFLMRVVSPTEFKELEIIGDEFVMTAGSQSKAALIGRNRRREMELKEIVKDYFKKNIKIA